MFGRSDRPWRLLYGEGLADPPQLEHPSALAAFRSAVHRAPGADLLSYFDRSFTVREIDAMSDALAAELSERGLGPGDRIATYMQNVPQYVVALLSAWKLGAALVPLNPMLRSAELEYQLNDSGAKALIALDTLWEEVAHDVVPATSVTTVVTTSGLDLQSTADPRLFSSPSRLAVSGTIDFVELLRSGRDRRPPGHDPAPAELAFLVYTSGTTGAPKGAMASHRNVMAIGQIFGDWIALGSDSVVLAVAPLFHITGLMCQLVPCLLTPAKLVLAFRYQPEVLLDAIRRERPTFAVGPVTAFIGMVQATSFRSADFVSFERIHSGGAPVSPATSSEFERLTGQPLLGAYGMTEATAATHLAPKGFEMPVDPTSGALAVGIPIPGVTCRIVDDDGNEVEPGTAGEVVLESPGVISGYWRRPEDTAHTIRNGQLFSGDIGVMDEQGWLYLVDRKKDLIICSGFKVWPREVEDALYEHPSVREVAVIGVPDDYRGESVKAFVSLNPGQEVTPEELLAFARERLASYKRPHEIEIQPELPKTVTGKILRRSLRAADRSEA